MVQRGPRRRRATEKIPTRIALPWYRREQYARLRELSVDPDNLQPSYDEWLASAERSEQELRSAGAQVTRVDVDVELLQGWCAERGLSLDGFARANCASARAHGDLDDDGP